MSSRFAVGPTRIVVTLIALACSLCLLGTFAAAQNNQPKDEVYGGYSWLHTGGSLDGLSTPDIASGFDLSNTYYLPQMHNLGILADFSYNFNGKNQLTGNENVNVFNILGGVQYKYHGEVFSPFARFLVGGVDHKIDYNNINQWSIGVGGGGGFDLNLSQRFSIRVIQADYIYNKISANRDFDRDLTLNSIRLSAGLVLNLGNYYNPPLSCTASASPTEVYAGETIKVSTTGTNFSPKHTLTYTWAGNGGKLMPLNTQTATIDTAGMAPGSYSANATIADAKMKKNGSASCSAAFSIKQPLPPNVSCSANPTTIAIGQPATITMTATDPQGWRMTYTWSATGGQLSGSGTSATLTATNADAGNTITVTGTATNDRNLSSSCTASVNVPPIQKCVNIEDWGECTFEKNPKKPWRVDNDCKDTLDKLSLRLQQMPNGKLDIVGYTDEKEVVKEQTLGSQRSVNVKYYLTTDGPTKVDAGRVQPRQGGTKGKATHFYFVPEGNMCGGQLEEGTVVDETQVQPQSRNAPAPKKHKAKPAAPPAQ